MYRSKNFTLNAQHPLARGLVSAGLGANSIATRYNDGSIKKRHGVLLNGATWRWSNTLNRPCCVLDKTLNQYVEIPTIQPTTQIAMSVWLKFADKTLQWNGGFGRGQALSTNCTWALESPGVAGRYCFVFYGSNGVRQSAILDIPDNNWHHWVGMYDGTKITIALDNKTFQYTPTTVSLHYNKVSQYTRFGHGYTGDSYNFSGLFSDILIWSRVLSRAEIGMLFNRYDVSLNGLLR